MTCEFFRNEFLPYLTAFSFPLSPRLPVSQQEISFIYKNRNPKLTFAGSHIPPSSLTSLPSQTHSPPEESSVTTAVSLDSHIRFLDGETEAWKDQRQAQESTQHVGHGVSGLLCSPLCHHAFSSGGSHSALFPSLGTDASGGAFPVIKGVWRKTHTAFSSLKLPGPSWLFNCAGSSPVPRASTPSGEGKGPKPNSWLLAPGHQHDLNRFLG